MKGDTPMIEYEDKPKRLRLIPVDTEGFCLLFGDKHELPVRSCPQCGHYMETSARWGGMPQWYCPVAFQGGACSNTQREPMAKMSTALAASLSEIRAPEKCHECGGENLTVEIRRRLGRIEVIVRHPAGVPCTAETVYIFQVFDSSEYQKQEWDKPKVQTVAETMKTLETWSREDAAKRVKESGKE